MYDLLKCTLITQGNNIFIYFQQMGFARDKLANDIDDPNAYRYAVIQKYKTHCPHDVNVVCFIE